MSAAKTSNHKRAPNSAAFVEEMRAVFGDLTVLYVEEGDFKLGEKYVAEFATTFVHDVSVQRSGEAKGADARGHAPSQSEIAA